MGRRGEEGAGNNSSTGVPEVPGVAGGVGAASGEHCLNAGSRKTQENLSLPAVQQCGANGAYWPGQCQECGPWEAAVTHRNRSGRLERMGEGMWAG